MAMAKSVKKHTTYCKCGAPTPGQQYTYCDDCSPSIGNVCHYCNVTISKGATRCGSCSKMASRPKPDAPEKRTSTRLRKVQTCPTPLKERAANCSGKFYPIRVGQTHCQFCELLKTKEGN